MTVYYVDFEIESSYDEEVQIQRKITNLFHL